MTCQVKVHLNVGGCIHDDILIAVDRPVDPRLCAQSWGGGSAWAPSCGCLEKVRNLRGLVLRQLATNLQESIRQGYVLIVVR